MVLPALTVVPRGKWNSYRRVIYQYIYLKGQEIPDGEGPVGESIGYPYYYVFLTCWLAILNIFHPNRSFAPLLVFSMEMVSSWRLISFMDTPT